MNVKFRNLFPLLALILPLACNARQEVPNIDEAGTTGGEDATEDSDTSTTTGDEGCDSPECAPPAAPVLRMMFSQIKQFDFEWNAVPGAEYYQLKESVNGEPHAAISGQLTGLKRSLTVPLHFRIHASYVLEACNDMGCTDSEPVEVMGTLAEAVGYLKASNTSTVGDIFGGSVAMSDDGNTLAIGADAEDSGATGIDGAASDDSAPDSGAVYVFVRTGTSWEQQAYVKASNTGADDAFGSSVALSGDGDTLAVGADSEDSSAKGIDGNQADESALEAGAVYVFVRDEETWTQQAYVKASNTDADDWFGSSVALSDDGDTLAVGAVGEDSSAIGVGGNQTDDLAADAGAVYVFEREGETWSQAAYVKAANAGIDDWFGWSVELSDDGDTLAVSAPWESSDGEGIDDEPEDDTEPAAGAVYVFVRDDETWTQQAYVKASNTDEHDAFGYSVALSSDGNTLAVGAGGEYSNATGIDGNQMDDSAPQAGAVYLFVRDGQTWMQQHYVKASNTDAYDQFGVSVALSDDGTVLIVGAPGEYSAATGIEGEQSDDSAMQAGAVYVFVRDGQTLTQRAYVKAPNTDAEDFFGVSVAASADATTLVVGAPWEDSSAMGVDGDQTDDSLIEAGAVYLY
jgi:hypothetical protein